MADRTSLGVLGCLLGGLTAVVAIVAFTVVVGHLEGRLALEAAPSQAIVLQN